MVKSELVAVEWNDAHGSDGTISAHEVDHKPYVYTTVGYLIRTDEVGVSLAHERGEDGKFRQITFVPRIMVVNEWPIGALKRPAKPRKVRALAIPGSTEPAV